MSATVHLPLPPDPSEPRCLPPTPKCVNSSTTAHAPPPPRPPKPDRSSLTQPCPFGPDWLSPTPTLSIQAQLLVYHFHHVLSSLIACLPLPPCQFRHNHSCPTLHHIFSSPIACLPLPPHQFEFNHLCPTLTISIQARPLMSHSHHVNSSTIACLLLPPRLFKPDHLCPTPTMSI